VDLVKYHSLSNDFFACTVFTLEPNNKFFKSVNIKRETFYSATVNQGGKLESLGNYQKKLWEIINKPSTRQLAFDLLQPLISNDYTVLSQTKDHYKSIKRLKKYLVKYRYFWYRYFVPQAIPSSLNVNEEELNYFAVQALYLISGI